MRKLLIYTDAPFFAGCEIVLENILAYDEGAKNYDVVFYYRGNSRYTGDLIRRGVIRENTKPIFVMTNDSARHAINRIIANPLLNKVLRVPFFVVEQTRIYSLFNYLRFLWILEKENPDVVHVNNGGYPAAESCRIMLLASDRAKISRTILTVNNISYPQKGMIDRLMDSKISRSIDYYVTASRAASKALISERKFDLNKARVIPNTCLYDWKEKTIQKCLRSEFGLDDRTFLIGSAGLLTKRKGYHVLVEAASKIMDLDGWKVYVFGDGEERKKLEGMIEHYGLNERVFLPGHRDNIADYVADLDVFVLPSTNNEDLPYVVSEAMLLERPIIGTYVAGIPEQVDDGVNGYLLIREMQTSWQGRYER